MVSSAVLKFINLIKGLMRRLEFIALSVKLHPVVGFCNQRVETNTSVVARFSFQYTGIFMVTKNTSQNEEG